MGSTKKSVVLLLLSSNFLTVFGWALLTPLYALYATKLGATPQAVTFTWSFYTLLAGILMITLGWAEDHIKHKHRLLSLGYAIQSIGVGALFFAGNLEELFIALGIYAIGTGIVMPIWKVMYAKSEHTGKEATEWGFFHGMNTLLISAAAAASGCLYVAFGFKGIIGLMVATHAAATIVSLGIGRSVHPR